MPDLIGHLKTIEMKSYLRFLGRNKIYTTIMAVGLSVSLALVIIMSCFVWQSVRVNRIYPDQDRIYLIGGKDDISSNAFLAEHMMEAIPEIEDGTSIINLGTPSDPTINDEAINRRSFMGIEKNFFDLFPTQFIYGGPEVLNDVKNAIITESLANLHGGTEVIGKTLKIGGPEEFTVSAIIEDFDDTIFDNEQIIVNFRHSTFDKWRDIDLTWHVGVLAIVKVKEDTDQNDLLKKMDKVYEKNIDEKYRHESYLSLTCLDKVYTSENNDGYSGIKKGNSGLMTAFSIIVVFLQISAIFNYINLSTALAGRRSKEISSRMLLGEDRRKVFLKNIYESLGFLAVCMCMAFILADLSLPAVNSLINSPIPVVIEFSESYIYIYLITLGITAALCGIIPGLISLKFKPIEVIKGSFRYESKRRFSKIFITIQNVIAIIIIAISLTMEAQIKHMVEMPLNANTDSLFFCKPQNAEFGKTLSELPFVDKYGRCTGRPGAARKKVGFPLNDDINNHVTLNICKCDSTSFELFGFKIVKNYETGINNGAWLTESAVSRLGIDTDNPVFPNAHSWAIDDADIVGIIEDVVFDPAKSLYPEAVGVVLVQPLSGKSPAYVARLSDPSAENINTLQNLCEKEVLDKYGPEMALNSGYIKDLIERGYNDMKKEVTMIEIFMAIAIMLSALGQIAMSIYYGTEKEKEICIRKVFGGTVKSESIRTIREYITYCLIAAVIAVPIALWIAQRYLETFIYRMDMPIWIFGVAVLAVIVISLASVIWQTLRAANSNPTEALKKE